MKDTAPDITLSSVISCEGIGKQHVPAYLKRIGFEGEPEAKKAYK